MAPPLRLPPALNKDVTAEILLRIPPDEPGDLFRASYVCRLWRRIALNPAFLCRYSAFHQGAPLLGFFHNLNSAGSFLGFVPTTGACSPPQLGHGDGGARWVSDCRHCRVLLREIGSRKFVIWDPFSNHYELLCGPFSWYPFQSNAVVLCAEPGCDHHNCRHGGRFKVVCLSIDNSDYTIFHTHVYSSESRSWCTPALTQLSGIHYFEMKRAALIRDGIYCTIDNGCRIMKYDLVEHHLSLIDIPHQYRDAPVLMQNQDGSLGIAGVLGSELYLLSTIVNAEGVTGWVQQRVIKLEDILPMEINLDEANVISFAEGVNVFFISTNVGAFTFELKSGRVRKVGDPRNYYGVNPFISFFTPDRGCSKRTE